MPPRCRTLPLVVVCWAALAGPCQEARADQQPRARAGVSQGRYAASIAAGLATALLPAVAGGTLVATADARAVRYAGLGLLQGGLLLGPVVSHLVAGEYARAAIFGATPLALNLGLAALYAAQPDVIDDGTTEGRVAFALLLSATVLSSAFGLIDSLGLPERARRRGLMLAPAASSRQVGLLLRGSL